MTDQATISTSVFDSSTLDRHIPESAAASVKSDGLSSSTATTESKQTKSVANAPIIDAFAAKLNAVDNKVPSPRAASSATPSPRSASMASSDSKSKGTTDGRGLERSASTQGEWIILYSILNCQGLGLGIEYGELG